MSIGKKFSMFRKTMIFLHFEDALKHRFIKSNVVSKNQKRVKGSFFENKKPG
jgi:hypothetical protein